MRLQEILISTRAAIEEQIIALHEQPVSLEYLWRQWFYLQGRINEASGTTQFDYDKLGDAIAKAISGTEGLQEPMALLTSESGATPDKIASLTVINIGENPGVLDNIELLPGEGNTWSATPGKVLTSIPFDATSTRFKIIYVIDK